MNSPPDIVDLALSPRGHHPRAGIVRLLSAVVTTKRPAFKRVWVARGVDDFIGTTVSKSVYAIGWDGTIDVEATASGTLTVTVEKTGAPPACS